VIRWLGNFDVTQVTLALTKMSDDEMNIDDSTLYPRLFAFVADKCLSGDGRWCR
jgi:hypothetical protein